MSSSKVLYIAGGKKNMTDPESREDKVIRPNEVNGEVKLKIKDVIIGIRCDLTKNSYIN